MGIFTEEPFRKKYALQSTLEEADKEGNVPFLSLPSARSFVGWTLKIRLTIGIASLPLQEGRKEGRKGGGMPKRRTGRARSHLSRQGPSLAIINAAAAAVSSSTFPPSVVHATTLTSYLPYRPIMEQSVILLYWVL